MILSKRKGQAIAEYVIIFAAVTAGALIAFGSLIKGGKAKQAFEGYVTGAQSVNSTSSSQNPQSNTGPAGGNGGSHADDHRERAAQAQ